MSFGDSEQTIKVSYLFLYRLNFIQIDFDKEVEEIEDIILTYAICDGGCFFLNDQPDFNNAKCILHNSPLSKKSMGYSY